MNQNVSILVLLLIERKSYVDKSNRDTFLQLSN